MKILYIGNFGKNGIVSGGQVGKTISIYQLFSKKGYQINKIDLSILKEKPFVTLLKIIVKAKESDKIFVLFSKNSRSFLLPILVVLKRLFNKQLLLYVIGGSLPQDVKKNLLLKFNIKKCDVVFVQTKTMIDILSLNGINNTVYSPSFTIREKPHIVSFNYFPQNGNEFKVFTFSRICEEKGITEAINAIRKINEDGKLIIYLDIYGIVDNNYKREFEKLLKENSQYINYCGNFLDKSVERFTNYFLYLFPTHHKGEGFPTTIVESMMASVPSIASNWMYNSEIIQDGISGFLYNNDISNSLVSSLYRAINETKTYNEMRKIVYEKSKEYSLEIVSDILCKYIER